MGSLQGTGEEAILAPPGKSFSKLRLLSADQREVLLQAVAKARAQCDGSGMTIEHALFGEQPPTPERAPEAAPDTPIQEPEQFGRCPCNYCDVNIEFPIHGIGQTVTCPKCGLETLLFDHREGSGQVTQVPEDVVPAEEPARLEEYVLPYSEYRNASGGFATARIGAGSGSLKKLANNFRTNLGKRYTSITPNS